MPSGGSFSAEACESASSSSGKSEETLAGGGVVAGAAGDGVVGVPSCGVVASCPAASCGAGERSSSNAAATTSRHKTIAPSAHPLVFKPPPVLKLSANSITGLGTGRGSSASPKWNNLAKE
jgi:hypothetical protein